MINIVPISDMKNYSEVLGHCDDGSVVLPAFLGLSVKSCIA